MRKRTLMILVLLPVVLILSVGLYLGSVAGELPWQEDPTRISTSLTPFADTGLPTFVIPPTATATSAP